jgi:hypothetical protein
VRSPSRRQGAQTSYETDLAPVRTARQVLQAVSTLYNIYGVTSSRRWSGPPLELNGRFTGSRETMWISGGAFRCSSRCGNGISMPAHEFVPDSQEHITLHVGDAILWIVDPASTPTSRNPARGQLG